MEGNNMRMPESFEDLDLAIEVLLELLVQSCELHRLDGNESASDL